MDDRRGGRPLMVGGGLGGIVLVAAYLLLGGDPAVLMQSFSTDPAGSETSAPAGGANDEGRQFVSVVLADTEDVWHKLFQEMGRTYQEPRLVLFSGRVDSACGLAGAATGPFYCPEDEKVYIDLSFYRELRERFGAAGDFAQAYVIAHEVGHHVQKQLGILQKVHAQRQRLSEAEYNALSVRLELQADFFAGVWAHHAQQMKNILESGDLEEALTAAAAIGDDRIQQQTQGTVRPDAFTHGSSAQRVKWFRKGFETGDLRQGDTFSAQSLD